MNSTIEIKPQRPAAASADVSAYLKPGSINLRSLPPLALYVHYPWCVRKCPYCDFNSHEASSPGAPEDEYLSALRADIEAALPLIWGRRIVSIFIGGGTPSLMSAAALDRLLSDVRALLPLALDCEITLEANPGTFEAERFASYRASGVNRLSIGIQSFDEQRLKALGRIHDRAQAFAAIEIAQRHFDNFNLDLMYALPNQSLPELQADIEHAIAVRPPHLSLYQLTLEPNTVFAKFPPELPDEDAAAAMQDWLEARTAAGWIPAATKCQRTQRPRASAATTSITGPMATILASAPARTAKSRFHIASFGRCGFVSRRPISSGPRLDSSSQKVTKFHAATCHLNSC